MPGKPGAQLNRWLSDTDAVFCGTKFNGSPWLRSAVLTSYVRSEYPSDTSSVKDLVSAADSVMSRPGPEALPELTVSARQVAGVQPGARSCACTLLYLLWYAATSY